jgi:hypothetical protein
MGHDKMSLAYGNLVRRKVVPMYVLSADEIRMDFFHRNNEANFLEMCYPISIVVKS